MISSISNYFIFLTIINSITCFTTKLDVGHISNRRLTRTSSLIVLPAKKKSNKKKGGTSGQGFGKQQKAQNENLSIIEEEGTIDNNDSSTLLQSIEEPQQSSPFLSFNNPVTTSTNQDAEESIASTEERTKQILQKQYGLRSYEQRQDNMKEKENEKKLQQLVQQAKKEEDVDLFSLIPAPLIIIIDGFLKVGLGISTVLFIAAGIGITLEAYSASSGNPLPENIDNFIANVIEPNFTIGLLVLLGFSISLGVFSLGQLGSKGSVYRED